MKMDEQQPTITQQVTRYNDPLISFIQFNRRVLNEATRKINPLFERINYLAIADSNTDEFIRTKFISSKKLKKELYAFTEELEIAYDNLISELNEIGICITSYKDICHVPNVEKYIEKAFNNIKCRIQPTVLRNELPIPDMQDGGYFIVTKLEDGFSGIIEIPDVKLIKIKSDEDDKVYLLRTDDIILEKIGYFYKGKNILWSKQFRVFRKVESLTYKEETQYIKNIEDELKFRKSADIVLVDISEKIDGIEGILGDAKKRKRKYIGGFGFLNELKDIVKTQPEHFYKKAKPRIVVPFSGAKSIFKVLDKQNVLVHYPYESFKLSALKFIEEASEDPNVVMIRQTLYRVSHDSPLIKALCTAAKNGKKVIVLLELKAKMDEEHNLTLIETLENAGCMIVYGPMQLKTHAKITLVIRRDDEGKYKKYFNISTGNFNDKTAKIYEDYSLFSKDRSKISIGQDLCELFNVLGGCTETMDLENLLIAPQSFRSGIEEQIRNTIKCKTDNPEYHARIIMKCNSFTDEKMADLLYEASSAGVHITLIVRGMCIIKAHAEGLSENIDVISIVGRYLEHSRVYYFDYLDGDKSNIHLYIGSGDMMPRNLDHRVEVITPILDVSLINKISDDLMIYINDKTNSYIANPDGTYSVPSDDITEDTISAQQQFINIYKTAEKSLIK